MKAMQQRQFTNHPAVSGLTYGFQELNIAGQRVLTQPGDMHARVVGQAGIGRLGCGGIQRFGPFGHGSSTLRRIGGDLTSR